MLVRKLSKALASTRRIPRNRQIRHHSNQTTCFPSRTLVELRHRGLVELEGEDTFKYVRNIFVLTEQAKPDFTGYYRG